MAICQEIWPHFQKDALLWSWKSSTVSGLDEIWVEFAIVSYVCKVVMFCTTVAGEMDM